MLQNGSYDFIAILSLSSNKGLLLYRVMGESERSDRIWALEKTQINY
jgi:hypothetical protein